MLPALVPEPAAGTPRCCGHSSKPLDSVTTGSDEGRDGGGSGNDLDEYRDFELGQHFLQVWLLPHALQPIPALHALAPASARPSWRCRSKVVSLHCHQLLERISAAL